MLLFFFSLRRIVRSRLPTFQTGYNLNFTAWDLAQIIFVLCWLIELLPFCCKQPVLERPKIGQGYAVCAACFGLMKLLRLETNDRSFSWPCSRVPGNLGLAEHPRGPTPDQKFSSQRFGDTQNFLCSPTRHQSCLFGIVLNYDE